MPVDSWQERSPSEVYFHLTFIESFGTWELVDISLLGDYWLTAGKSRQPTPGDDRRSALHQVGGPLPRPGEEGGGAGHQEVGQGHCPEAQDDDKEVWVAT